VNLRRTAVRLYPGWWRARYGAELEALLEAEPPGTGDLLDLVRGALDAHLHSGRPGHVGAVAALTGGALWTIAALVVAAEPVPVDWPGYTFAVLPLTIAGTAMTAIAVSAAWLRIGDGASRFDRFALLAGVFGHLVWLAALLAVVIGVGYGWGTGLASTSAAIGIGLVGVALARHAVWPLAAFVVAAPATLVAPVQGGWLAYGLLWSVTGLVLLASTRRTSDHPTAA
jgi:hypothetical protein